MRERKRERAREREAFTISKLDRTRRCGISQDLAQKTISNPPYPCSELNYLVGQSLLCLSSAVDPRQKGCNLTFNPVVGTQGGEEPGSYLVTCAIALIVGSCCHVRDGSISFFHVLFFLADETGEFSPNDEKGFWMLHCNKD